MRNINELNINEGGSPVEREAPSDNLISLFESKTGLTIPSELLSLLKVSNGGHPELDSIFSGCGEFAVDAFYHLSDSDYGPGSLWYAVEHWSEILGEGTLPFAHDGGGNQFFLNLSGTQQTVGICLHNESFRVLKLAPSFSDFIDSLEIDPEMI
jgi:hypothetical protein